jgi:hypothetical protein
MKTESRTQTRSKKRPKENLMTEDLYNLKPILEININLKCRSKGTTKGEKKRRSQQRKRNEVTLTRFIAGIP